MNNERKVYGPDEKLRIVLEGLNGTIIYRRTRFRYKTCLRFKEDDPRLSMSV